MKKILLVEDSDADALQFQRAIDQLDIANPVHRVHTAEDALAYLDDSIQTAAIAAPPASILMIDLLLPGMSGLELLEKVAGRRGLDQTLRIVLSNINAVKTIQRAYTLGARSFLIKPVQPADLHELAETYPGYWAFAPQLTHAL